MKSSILTQPQSKTSVVQQGSELLPRLVPKSELKPAVTFYQYFAAPHSCKSVTSSACFSKALTAAKEPQPLKPPRPIPGMKRPLLLSGPKEVEWPIYKPYLPRRRYSFLKKLEILEEDERLPADIRKSLNRIKVDRQGLQYKLEERAEKFRISSKRNCKELQNTQLLFASNFKKPKMNGKGDWNRNSETIWKVRSSSVQKLGEKQNSLLLIAEIERLEAEKEARRSQQIIQDSQRAKQTPDMPLQNPKAQMKRNASYRDLDNAIGPEQDLWKSPKEDQVPMSASIFLPSDAAVERQLAALHENRRSSVTSLFKPANPSLRKSIADILPHIASKQKIAERTGPTGKSIPKPSNEMQVGRKDQPARNLSSNYTVREYLTGDGFVASLVR